jgi:hypothetical protein
VGFWARIKDRARPALHVDPAGILGDRAGEVGDRLFGVGHGKHHVVQVGFVDDVHVLQRAFNLFVRMF